MKAKQVYIFAKTISRIASKSGMEFDLYYV